MIDTINLGRVTLTLTLGEGPGNEARYEDVPHRQKLPEKGTNM